MRASIIRNHNDYTRTAGTTDPGGPQRINRRTAAAAAITGRSGTARAGIAACITVTAAAADSGVACNSRRRRTIRSARRAAGGYYTGAKKRLRPAVI
jgi:hypothetical protein